MGHLTKVGLKSCDVGLSRWCKMVCVEGLGSIDDVDCMAVKLCEQLKIKRVKRWNHREQQLESNICKLVIFVACQQSEIAWSKDSAFVRTLFVEFWNRRKT